MFTGLIEETGQVRWLRQRTDRGFELAVSAAVVLKGCKPGESIAVNGCCLTVTGMRGEVLTFDLLQETLNKTNLGQLRPEALVNLERCVTPATRMGGHFVQGHVDGVSEVLAWEQVGADWRLDVLLPGESAGYVAYKGSIAINGISLTVAEVSKTALRVWIIPHTREVTNLRTLCAGDQVNLEFDLLAKYVESILEAKERGGSQPSSPG